MPSLSFVITVIVGLLICTLLLIWISLGFDAYHKARAYGESRRSSLQYAIYRPILGRG